MRRVVDVRAGVLVAPSVDPSISSAPSSVLIEHDCAFELPQITIADACSATGFGSALKDTDGAGGVTTGTEHVATGLIRAPFTHCRKYRIVVEPVADDFWTTRPTATPFVANPVELALPVRHDHDTVTGVDVPNGTDAGEHESDAVSGGVTTGCGNDGSGGYGYGDCSGYWRGYCCCATCDDCIGAPPLGAVPPVGFDPPVGVQPYTWPLLSTQ